MTHPRPLAGLFVLDFSTLLPGPLATLMLAEAGAEVVKIERPGDGEDMRRSPQPWRQRRHSPCSTAASGASPSTSRRRRDRAPAPC